VNAPPTLATGDDVGAGEAVNRSVGEGVGICGAWPNALSVSSAAGMKYARPPAPDERTRASATRTMVRKGLRRRRDALARWPGLLPSGTGGHCNPGVGIGW